MRSARNLIVGIVLALAVSLQAQEVPAREETPSKPVTSLGKLYTDSPEYSSAIMGDFAMDVALVDLDKDGYMDMVMSNGSDMSPQPLTVFRNRLPETRTAFRPWPDWYSGVIEYMTGMAVGDIDQDGWMDVAVAVAFDKSRDISTGSVKVFHNVRGELQPTPAFETAYDGFMPVSCALADVDVDGDLDLIVPALIEGSGTWGGDRPLNFKAGRARIYLNKGGKLSPKPEWVSVDRLGAGSVTAADFNQDGWMDLAFGSAQPAVYYGAPPVPPDRITIPATPGWMSTTAPIKAQIPIYRTDAGFYGKADQQPSVLPAKGAGLMLAVSPGCATSADFPCESSFFLYLPQQGTEPVWSSAAANFAGGIALADLNGDGFVDLATGQWGLSLPGGPIWLFQGPFSPGILSAPAVTLDIPRVWQAFGAANIHCEPATNETLRHIFTIRGPVTVLTLPQRIVSEVLEVMEDGNVVNPKQWTWSPDANWVSLAKPAPAETVITVTYRIPKLLDLATAVWNPDTGSDVFFSFLRRCPE